jgi:8-oxo-dGTP pyrophosphatase MutT (NUDIX family)
MSPHDFIADIQRHLSTRIRHQYKRQKRAGILVPFIFEDGQEPRLLLTRRTDQLSSHKGEVAFPGGMMDADDQTIIETALREAEEEVGLPRENVTVIGLLDDLISKNIEIMVTPSIGVITTPPETWTPNPSEVAKVFEIPLSMLYEAHRWRIEQKVWKTKSINIYYFDFEGETLWGLSAYATLLALDQTDQGSPVDLSPYYHQLDQVRALFSSKKLNTIS